MSKIIPLMLVHDRPDLAQLNINALHGLGYENVFVHVDGRVVMKYPKLYNCKVMSHCELDWGSHRMMDAIISSIKFIINTGIYFDHIMVCSGKDIYGTKDMQSECKIGISYQPYAVETSENYLSHFNLDAINYEPILIDYRNIIDPGFKELKTSSSWLIISRGDCITLIDKWTRYRPVWYNRICVEEHFPASTIDLKVMPYLHQIWDSYGDHPIDIDENMLAHIDVGSVAIMRKVSDFGLLNNYYKNVLKVV